MSVEAGPQYKSIVMTSHRGRLSGYVAIAAGVSFVIPGLLSTESYSTLLLLLPLALVVVSLVIYYMGRKVFFAEFYEDIMLVRTRSGEELKNVRYIDEVESCRLREITGRSGLYVQARAINLKLQGWTDEVEINNLQINGKWKRDKDKILEFYDWLLPRTKLTNSSA